MRNDLLRNRRSFWELSNFSSFVPTVLCQPFNQLSLLPHIYEKGLVILLLLLLLLDLRNNPARRANS